MTPPQSSNQDQGMTNTTTIGCTKAKPSGQMYEVDAGQLGTKRVRAKTFDEALEKVYPRARFVPNPQGYLLDRDDNAVAAEWRVLQLLNRGAVGWEALVRVSLCDRSDARHWRDTE